MEQTISFSQLRRWFGRTALSLLIVIATTQLLSYGVVSVWVHLFGQLGYSTLILFNDLCVYLP